MRDYLIRLLGECAYPERDARCLLSLYDAIEADPDSSAVWNALLQRYRQDIRCDFEALRADSRAVADRLRTHPYTVELLLFLSLSRCLRERYAEQCLPDGIFLDSILDLRYKLEECREVYGICGTFVGSWFEGFFRLTRFALGRLQFELIPFSRVYSKNGHELREDSPVLNMHIPRSGQPLLPSLCRDSFSRALSFYEKELAGKEKALVCHSWLLYPAHREFLPPHSNILSFMDFFDIFEQGEYGEDQPHFWRIFDRPYTGDPATLSYDTSLRRAYVDRVRSGGKTGWGHGVIFASDPASPHSAVHMGA